MKSPVVVSSDEVEQQHVGQLDDERQLAVRQVSQVPVGHVHGPLLSDRLHHHRVNIDISTATVRL